MSTLKSLSICVVVGLVDAQIRHVMHPVLRLSVDVVLYGALAIALGVVRVRDVKAVMTLVKNRKQQPVA
jgi:hypothetical protein